MKSVWVKLLVAFAVLVAAACTDASDDSALPDGADEATEGEVAVDPEEDGGGDETGAETTEAVDPYCDALPADLVAFINDPAGLNPGDPATTEASFRALAAAGTDLVDRAPAEVAEDAILRREVLDAYVAALESVGWDVGGLESDDGAIALLDETIGRPGHQDSLRALADHDETLCELRGYPADEDWPATEASEVAADFLNPYNVVAGFTGADTELMRSATEPGSPAAGYAEFRAASLEFIPSSEAAFRPVVDGDEILACNGSICARYGNFSLTESGLVDNYVVNGLPIDRAVVDPVDLAVGSGDISIDSVQGYINTANQLQVVIELSSQGPDTTLDVLTTSFEGAGGSSTGLSTLQTSVPSEVTVSPDARTRALLIFRPKVRLPGTLTLVFDDGSEVAVELRSMADRP